MRKLTVFLAFLLFAGFQASAQMQISGKVTNAETGDPIPGVSVVVKSQSTIGTTTDMDGNYTLKNVPSDAETLVFSYVGMQEQEIPINGRTTINVELEPSVQEMDEVVVTAMGISRDKKSLGYAISEVGGDDINRTEKENLIQGLSGKVSGVNVKNSTNMGGSSNILIRGASSLTGDNRPLFVVDGVPVSNMNTNTNYQSQGGAGYDYGDPISDINPNDIKSMSVLKGSAATALYGSRAANGVIVIKTKTGDKTKGDQKALSVDVNSTTMIHSIDESTFPEYQKKYGAGYGPYYSGSDIPYLYNYDFDGDGSNDYVVPTTEDASRGARFDPNLNVYKWKSFFPELPSYNKKFPYTAADNGPVTFFETGRTLTNNVAISGGTQDATFRLSYTNTDMSGVMPNSERKKNNISLNSSFDFMDNLTVSASANYTNTYTKGRNRTGYSDNILSSFRQWWNVGVDMKEQKEFYNLTKDNVTWNPNSENNLAPIYWDNFYFQRNESYQDDERDRIIGNIRIDYDINENINFSAQYSMDNWNFLQEERKAVGSVAGAFGVDYPDVRSGYTRKTRSFIEQNFNAKLRYQKDFENFDLSAMLGTNIRREKYESVKKSTNGGLAVPGVFALSNSASPMLPPNETLEEIGVNGVFASFSWGYQETLFLDGSIRRDVSSTLPEDNNVYVYPSISTSFIFDELLPVDWLDLGKVRLNWAQVGSDAPWGRINDSYRIVAPFGSSTLTRVPYYKNNPDLKPEISTSYEAGLELAMFNNRLSADFAIFKEEVENQIIPLAVSFASGYEQKLINGGQMDKDGIEISLNGTPVKNKDFMWNVSLHWSKYESVVADLGKGVENQQIGSLQGGVTINAREGEPYGAIQGTDFKYSPNGERIVGPKGQYEVTGTSDKVIGNIQPDWTAGISNSLNYKGFSFSFLVDMQMGGNIFSLDQWYGMSTGLYPETVEMNDKGNQERLPIDEGGGIVLDGVMGVDSDGDGEYDSYKENTTRISGDRYSADGYAVSPNARYIYDATYVKLREASIGYNLPKSIIGNSFEQVRLSIVGSNLWIIYKDLPYADPEASQGAGNIQGWQSGVMPTTRNIGLKVNVRF